MSFKDNGAIFGSGIARNVKVIVGLFQADNGDVLPLTRLTVKRRGGVVPTVYKTWMGLDEVYAAITTLQRAAYLIEEYREGNVDLEQVLSADPEVARLVVTPTSVQPKSIEDLVDYARQVAEEVKKEERRRVDTTPLNINQEDETCD